MPQETKSKFEPEVSSPAEGVRPATLQGLVVTDEDRQALLTALENAFDYRGDVALTLNDGARIEGYIFDRVTGKTLGESYVRLLTAHSEERVLVAFSNIVQVDFCGRDTAAGKTWENWLKRYIEKKRAGERASIESESLE
jgi:hypothetical protein